MAKLFSEFFVEYLNDRGMFITEEDNDSESDQNYTPVLDTDRAVKLIDAAREHARWMTVNYRMTFTDFLVKYSKLTDKHRPGGHSYGPYYEAFLNKFRMWEIDILLLGVSAFGGGDVLAFLDYFYAARIWGVDTSPLKVDNPRFTFINSDAYRVGTIPDNVKFQVIVDDCHHDVRHQIKALELYMPTLNQGGVYVVEDLGPEWEAEDHIYGLTTHGFKVDGRHVSYIDLAHERPNHRPNDNRLLVIH